MSKVQTWYVNRDSGGLIHITKVDDNYAYIETPTGSRYSMPIADFDTVFVERFRPARPEDLQTQEADIRLPANAPADWTPVDIAD